MNCPNCKIPTIETKKDFYQCGFCGFNAAKNSGKIKKLYAWLSVDKDGNEGIVATQMNTPHGEVIMTCISSDKRMIEEFRPEIESMKKETGMDFVLKEYCHDS